MSEGPITTVETVTLTVRDAERVAAFYRDVLGLKILDRSDGTTRLGADKPLLDLVHDAGAEISSAREAGLFHTAFLLPTRADLGAWLRFAAERGVKLDGAADHAVSEAVYLADPEGNGIEIYADKPVDVWPWANGEVQFVNDPLDFAGIAEAASAAWDGAPDGTIVGHIHLRVGEIAAARDFYAGVLGLPITASTYPGAHFYGAHGYHHHVGNNIWSSRGAGPRRAGTTGLANVRFGAEGSLDGLAAAAEARGLTVRTAGRAVELADPWGTKVTVAA